MNKHIISILTVGALLLSFAACGKQAAADATGTNGEPDTTYTGTVCAISTKSITVATDAGEVTIPLTEATVFSSDFVMGGQMPGNMEQFPDGMGEIPSDIGEIPSDMGEIPSDMGDIPTDGGVLGSIETSPEGTNNPEAPEKPDGEVSGAADPGKTPPELPEGENGQGDIPVMDPNQAQSATIAVVYIGASVTVVTDDNGCAATVTVSGGNMAGMQQP